MSAVFWVRVGYIIIHCFYYYCTAFYPFTQKCFLWHLSIFPKLLVCILNQNWCGYGASQWIRKFVRPRERVELNRQTCLIFHISSDLCVAATLFIICNWFLYSFHAFSTDSEQASMKKLIQGRTGSVHVLQRTLHRFYTQNGIMSVCCQILHVINPSFLTW